jgi:hypothetical protein
VCAPHMPIPIFFLCLVKYQIFRVDTVIIKEKNHCEKIKKLPLHQFYIFF